MFTPFYHRLLWKYVVAFGDLFNNITLIRYNADFTQEKERIKVPLTYSPKEKWVTRLMADPNLVTPVGIILPRMSYNITGMQFDGFRKQPTTNKVFSAGTTTSSIKKLYMYAPWDIAFDLNIYARNIEDANQIVEQILPYFQPDYSITINPITGFNLPRDIHVALGNVQDETDWNGPMDTPRLVMWTLSFVMKTHFYGPVTAGNIIRKAIVHILDNTLEDKYLKINLGAGSGRYKEGDIAFQGDSMSAATAVGEVTHFANGYIELKDTQGTFQINVALKGTTTNADYIITSFKHQPPIMVRYQVEPNPNTAEPTDDYGYTETLTEWPNAAAN